MLDTAELDSLRADYLLTLPDVASIQSVTNTADGMGGFTQVWATVATVACRLLPRHQGEAEIAEQERPVVEWELAVPFGTALTNMQRVVINNTTYYVEGVDTGHSEAICLVAQLKLVG